MDGTGQELDTPTGDDPHSTAIGQSSAGATADGDPSDDPLLDLIERWDARFRAGDDPALETLGATDPVVLDRGRELIKRQKLLYGALRLGATHPSEPAHCVAPLPSFPGHEILCEIGHGGMGVVYKARDLRLGRLVAIKTMAEGRHASVDQRARFQSEALAVARLHHANIVAIHAIGEHEKQPYLVLEYVEGGSLAERLAEGRMAIAAAAGLVDTLARAVEAAHHAGIVHRDLKPSNVLLTADGSPKVGDFGLAKLAGSDSARTLSGQIMGSPSFMAPEQAEGRSKQVGPAADVYALGAILYHALAGRPPFLGDSASEPLKLVVSADVVPPRRQRPGVPRDLETICLKCLEKEPRKRYASALALADDLERFRAGLPIAARPVGVVGKLWRHGRRNPVLSLSLAALALTFALGTPALFWLWLRARNERDHAERSRDRALGAVRLLLETGGEANRSEEVRPYRQALIAAGLNESLALVRDLEADPRAEFQRVEAYAALAAVQYEDGDRTAALESIRKSIALCENLIARDPASIRVRFTLADCLHKFAGMWPEENEYFSAARRSIEHCEALRALYPRADQRDWISLIGMNHFNVGNRQFVAGRKSEALESLLKASEAFESLIENGDRRPQTLTRSARSHAYLCRVYSHLGQLDDALAQGRYASGIYQKLIAEHPHNPDYGFDLCQSESVIGLMAIAYERWSEAIESFASTRSILKEMAAKHGRLVSRMAMIQTQLAAADHNLRDAYDSDRARFRNERRALAREGYEICDKIRLVEPLSANMRIAYAHCCFSLADDQDEDGRRPDLDLYRKAEQLFAELVVGAPEHDENRSYLVYVERRLAEELAARGEFADAAIWQSRSTETAQGRPPVFYRIARDYGRRLVAMERLPAPPDARAAQLRRRRLVEGTLAMLRQAAATGYKDIKRLRTDPAFEPVRSCPEYEAILCDASFPADPIAAP